MMKKIKIPLLLFLSVGLTVMYFYVGKIGFIGWGSHL